MLVEVQKVKTKRAFILKKINIYMKMLKTTEIEHYNLTIKIMSSRFISRDSWWGRSPNQLSRDRNQERII